MTVERFYSMKTGLNIIITFSSNDLYRRNRTEELTQSINRVNAVDDDTQKTTRRVIVSIITWASRHSWAYFKKYIHIIIWYAKNLSLWNEVEDFVLSALNSRLPTKDAQTFSKKNVHMCINKSDQMYTISW